MAGRPLESLSASPTLDVPSANPLDLLPLRQLFVFVGRAHGREMTAIASTLGIARETAYQDLDAATRELQRLPAEARQRARPVPQIRRVFACRRHRDRDCPRDCAYLTAWMTAFDRAMRPTPRREG